MAEPTTIQTRISEEDVRNTMSIQFGTTKSVLFHLAKAKKMADHINLDITGQNTYALAAHSAEMVRHVEEAYRALAGDGKTLA